PRQFIALRLHARAAQADAGADRVDRRIPGNYADFRARPGIAGHRLDLYDAVINFRHLLREQFRHELGMGAGQKNLRAPGFAPHVENIGADTVAVAEHLSRQHLVATDDGFAAAQIDNDAAIFDALDNAIDDIADAVLEFPVLAVALALAHLLHDDLFGGLRGNALVFQRRQGVGNGVADLRSGIGAPRVFQGDLVGRILDLLDHEHVAGPPQLALLGVDLGVYVGFAAVAGARRLGDGVFHRRDHDPP